MPQVELAMLLTDSLDPRWIKVPLEATTKQGLIQELIDVLADGGALDRPAEALQAVLAREQTRTTAVGGGVALPHGKTPAAKELLTAFGIAAQPVDFDSVDGRPVDLVMLLLSPKTMTGPHIQALARISRLLGDEGFRDRLRATETAQQAYELFRRQEQELE